MGCLICQYTEECRQGANPRLVHEFEHSYLTVGEHQFFEGYCVLLFKEHVRDLHELSAEVSAAFYEELMVATRAIAQAYGPAKMNHASYGNAQPHLHWHIFPRYANDPDREKSPWLHQDEFGSHVTTAEQAAEVRNRLLPFLSGQP